MGEIYRSGTIVVRRVATADPSRWVVTFDHHNIQPGFERPGFGETFFRSEGISAMHVLGRGNDWYQYEDMPEACAAIRTALAGAARVIAYGSSMGGYGALRFADAVGAHAMLALSPQYSNDPTRLPWEMRWRQEAHATRWLPALGGPLRYSGQAVIVYDPASEDKRHADLIAAELATIAIPIPHANHPVSTYLSEAGLLRPLVLDLVHDRFDPPGYVRSVRAARRTSSTYLATLADRQPAWRRRTAFALARKGAEIGVLGQFSLARLLTETGRHDEALAIHREILSTQGREAIYLMLYGEALFAAGDLQRAEAVMVETIALLPERAHLRSWRAKLLWKTRRYGEAVAEQRRATELDPRNGLYRRKLRFYRAMAMVCPMLDGLYDAVSALA